jgi:hypothetical protein
MSESLENKTSMFEGIEQRQVVILLDVLRDSRVTAKEHIERKFLELATNYETTVKFLEVIGIIQTKKGKVSLVGNNLCLMDQRHNSNFSRLIINLITQKNNSYRKEIFEYFSRFKVDNGIAKHRPTDEERSAESSVRNYLMELGAVSYDNENKQYTLNSEYNAFYAQAMETIVSEYQFKCQQRKKEDIGLAAEVAIYSYEQQRVGKQYEHLIEHVAKRNIAAGYDIKSVTVYSTATIVPRYIEVKAVPCETFQFYWTANEIAVAKQFQSWYYLYLLPVSRNGSFNCDKLYVINDPQSTIFNKESAWTVEHDVVCCSLTI